MIRVGPAQLVVLALLPVAGFAAGCSRSQPAAPPAGLHDDRRIPNMLGQRVLACDDGTRLDVDFLADGLRMVVTRMPGSAPETLVAQRTGAEFKGPRTHAVIAGRSIAFERAGAPISICHGTE